ncbi:hypothetical protein [Amycolatopsis kentuckyensis]|uniref:hypothetical protein n=1 Tax=Amycolatopsis kentuckyensis TaxID=218823 RepID=UPI000A3B85CC|nr:hypothetical protein [Amycolatopsis kentuckyensis]
MADAPLSLRCTRSGTAYVDGPLVANDWDNTALLGGVRGVLVTGTDDPDRAQAHADEAVRHYFGPGAAARPCSAPTRWRLFYTSEDRDELEWRPSPDAAEPAVLFTAEEADRG